MRRTAIDSVVLRRVACALMFLAAGCLSPGVFAAGAPGVEALAGWEGDSRSQGYGYAGLGVLLPAGERLTVPLRAFGSFLYYNFEEDGTTTRVTSPGVTLLTGLRVSASRGNLTMLGGGEVRREHRTFETGAGTTQDRITSGVVLQLDGDAAFGRRWRGYLFANYGGASSYLYTRTAMRFQATNLDSAGRVSFFMGMEGVGQGNDESEAVEGGGFLEWNFVAARVSLALHGGYKENWSPGEEHLRGGYLGIGVYHRF